MRFNGRDLLLTLSMVAIIAGASCDGCRDEPEPQPIPPVVEEPSRRDRILDAVTDRVADEIENREAPEGDR